LKTIVMFSSGIGSWAAAKRRAETHGTDGMVLLFADTLIEDEDNYRFLHEAAANIGAPLEIIKDGRTPWEVMRKNRIIGNSSIDPCSAVLKRKLLDKWRDANGSPETTTVILGISWDEHHRLERVQGRVVPWRYEAPLCEAPYLTKRDLLAWAKREGLKPPRLYDFGFPHANCGGFCIKAGQAQFALLLRTFPERYAEHEREEESMRNLVGDHSIMSDRSGDGQKKVLTMRMLRERIEAQQPIDEFEWGGCGCALPL
jgi:3'-phosphoadenosine 5'-phosphosulfate sulfotransferase (PAPS reductase)/FAD synthetase